MANGGPSHDISLTKSTLFLGARVGGEATGAQGSRANGDDITTLPDDEDGLIEPAQDLVLTVSTAPVVRVRATNTTGSAATLYGWIDFNRDGVFDNATERTSVTVANSTNNGTFTLTFPTIPDSASAGTTYARIRLSTDVAAANSTGAATGGEVEDYVLTITQRSTGIADSGKSVKLASGMNGTPTLVDKDRFGHSVASLGDLDGDGVTDLAVGAIGDITGGGDFSYRGAVRVLMMNANGTVKSSVKIASGTNGGPTLADFHRFGSSIASLGDFDGDGVTDLIVGAIGDDTGGAVSSQGRGAAYVLLLNTNGTVKSSVKIASDTNGGPTLGGGVQFGSAVSSLGDLDGDGVTDLAVGAYSDSTGGTERGAVYVLLMNMNGTVKSSVNIASGTNGGPTLVNQDHFGTSVTSLGDLDGDGVTDLAVGAYRDGTGATYPGAVHVLFLNSNGTVKSSTKIASDTNGGPTLASFDFFGSSVASVGDLDGDGVTDLAVGARGDNTGATYSSKRGAVHVLFLNSNGTVKSSVKIASDTNGGPTAANAHSFGISLASLGDLDGDGVTELAVGADRDNTGGEYRGAVHVLFLKRQFGTTGSDIITGTTSNDDIAGGDGNDLISGLGGNDSLQGNSENDTLIGGQGSDSMSGGSGNDLLQDGVGNDLLLGDGGDDVIVVSGSITTLLIDGGLGTDTLSLSSAGIVIDLTTLSDASLQGIEQIDLTGSGNNTLTLTQLEVLNLSDSSNTLLVRRDFGDTVNMGSGWTRGGTETIGTETFAVFIQGAATLKVQNPSVLNLSALNGTSGFRLNGDEAGALSGFSVSSAGDFNGDGFDDVLIGANLGGHGVGFAVGATYVVFGKPSAFSSEFDLSSLNGTDGFRIDGIDPDDQSGFSVSDAGDLNGDGFDDLIIGAEQADPNGNNDAGECYVVFGKASGFGATLSLSALNGTTGFRLEGIAANDFTSRSVSSAADVNGDGFADLIIGAASRQYGATGAGKTFVVFGKSSGFSAVVDLNTLNGSNGFRLDGANAGDLAGNSVSSAGDINGDGYGDLILGASAADHTEATNVGDSYVIFGKLGGFTAVIGLGTLNGTNGFRIPGLTSNDSTGHAVSSAGDVNGDGFDDFVVTAPYADANGRTDAGQVYVVFGKSSSFGAELDLSALNGSNGFRLNGISPNDAAGFSASSAGDVNGDGFDDLVIGARYADPNGRNLAGQSYVVFGKSSGFSASINLSTLDGASGFRINGTDAEDRFGHSVSNAGDLNGDGFDDLIISSPSANTTVGSLTGESYVLFGGNFTGGPETKVGTSTANTLTATRGAEAIDILIGAQGNDILISDGGADVLRGGQGNDLFQISNLTFQIIAGGTGTDTLRLDGSGIHLNLLAIADNKLTGIEAIDLRGSGVNRLLLKPLEVLNLSDSSNSLLVMADQDDSLFIGGGWATLADQQFDGASYRVFTNGAADGLHGGRSGKHSSRL